MGMKRFIEFATQNTNNGEINSGFNDIKTDEWYYTKDSENAKNICELLNELHEENEQLKNKYVDEFALRETLQLELQRIENENKELKQKINELQTNKAIGQQEYQRRLQE